MNRISCLLFTAMIFLAPAASAQTQENSASITKLRYITVLVKNYDEALNWYTDILGFKKVEDRNFGAGQRWLVVAPNAQDVPGIVLAVPKPITKDDPTRNYMDRIGKETNWVFSVTDCRGFYERAHARGVHFLENPTDQPWGTTQAIFEDLYGNVFVIESTRKKTDTKGSL